MTNERCRLLAVVLCLVAGCFLLGCGADFTIQLPNDHYVVVANSNDVAINSATGETLTKWSVGKLADTGDFVYGTIVNPDTQLFQEYFVLDTGTSEVNYYSDKEEWATVLNAVGVTSLELRGLSAFYNLKDQIWWRAALVAVFIVLVALPAWIWHRSIKKARELRVLHSQPGY